MEIRHLRYFVAVAEELNFRRAAERLHLSTPTLSQQVKDLEAEVGVRLFERDTTRVSLTGPGHVFLEEVRLLLAHSARAVAAARDAAQGRRGTLRIGNAGPLSHGFMPACLQGFGKKFPDVDVVLVELDLNAQAAAVAEGSLQIGFALRPDGAPAGGLSYHRVVQAPLQVVLGTAHPLAARKKIALAELARTRLLAIGGTKISSHGEYLSRVFAGRGVKIAPPRAISGYEAFLAMLASGQGISLLPKFPRFAALEGLTGRPLRETGDDLTFEAYAIWRKTPAPIVENFIAVLRKIRP